MSLFKLAELVVEITQKGLNEVQSALHAVDVACRRVQAGIETLGRVARRAFLGISGAIVFSGKQVLEFERLITFVKAVTGASEEEAQALEDLARALGTKTLYTAQNAAQAMRQLAIAGLSVKEILAVLPPTLNLAAVENMDLADAARITINTMRGMRIEASDMSKVIDIFAKAASRSNTDIYQLGLAMSYVGPIAHLAGFGLEEISAAVMVLSNAGIQAERAGTGLRRTLIELSTQARKGAKGAFAQLGISALDTEGKLRPLSDIFNDLNAAMEKIPKGKRPGVLKEIFGLRAMPGVAALLETLVANSGKLEEIQAMLAGSTGTAAALAERQMKTLYGVFHKTKAIFRDLGITIGKIFTPELERVGFVLQGLFRHLDAHVKALGPMLVHYAKWGLAITGIIALLPMLTRMVQFAVTAFTSFGLLLIWLVSNPIGMIIGAIIALAATLVYLSGTGETFWEKLGSGFKYWAKLLDHMLGSHEAFKKGIKIVWDQIVALIEGALVLFSHKVVTHFGGAFHNLKTLALEYYKWYSDVLLGLAEKVLGAQGVRELRETVKRGATLLTQRSDQAQAAFYEKRAKDLKAKIDLLEHERKVELEKGRRLLETFPTLSGKVMDAVERFKKDFKFDELLKSIAEAKKAFDELADTVPETEGSFKDLNIQAADVETLPEKIVKGRKETVKARGGIFTSVEDLSRQIQEAAVKRYDEHLQVLKEISDDIKKLIDVTDEEDPVIM